ncbi:aromatase/cyclase [Kitasatospora viridis]|uniref:Ribosome-associated toxin RatA of RatAB toxin-antitoxin module n=1 Tax=Kitasatospora viridis TaxID=281105 RepID=A0A561SF06_9ACTN|nr:ribosome-associated toxin RatA of RatAB toxin-antitoxin module [Kitasatospora viridis]
MPCLIRVEGLLSGQDADEVFDRIRDFERYADHTDAVREVTVTADQAGTVDSAWAVNFRGGVLRWTERDVIDAPARAITFEQLTGDFARFVGTWDVRQTGDDVVVLFSCEFDMGIPSLEPIINPVAMRALIESIGLILRGLLGEGIEITSSHQDTAVVGS